MSLSKSELARYQRQMIIDGWDQERLKAARVLIVGAGGLGGVAATYLATAGIGAIRICDHDKVEESNLNRQILFSKGDIGQLKAELAKKRLISLNPDIKIEPIFDKIAPDNINSMAVACDLIIDGLDNHADRLLLNQASIALNIPYVYGAINEWQGQAAFFNPPKTACLACIMSEIKQGQKPVPVFGALPGMIGSFEAIMALKYLISKKNPAANRLFIFDGNSMAWDTLEISPNPKCPACGK